MFRDSAKGLVSYVSISKDHQMAIYATRGDCLRPLTESKVVWHRKEFECVSHVA